MTVKAAPDTIYAAAAALSLTDTTTQVRLPGGRSVEGVICAASVSEDGSEMELTVEVPDGTLPGYSIGVQP